ncbi:MAG TPA: ATPase, T2SS/T4P/T4SS family [Polymorphobacter sp.]|nr:ATPase, T2SS/T4P/T4SS family [Polymorphobacter sp.]
MSAFGRRADTAAVAVLGPARGLVASTPQAVTALLQPLVAHRFDPARDGARPRGELAAELAVLVDTTLADQALWLDAKVRRGLVTQFLHGIIAAGSDAAPAAAALVARSALPGAALGDPAAAPAQSEVARVVPLVYPLVMERIDSAAAAKLGRGELARRLTSVVADVLTELALQLNQREQRELVTLLLDDMLGLGPLEPLLADDSINDILVNGAAQVFVERRGRLEHTDVTFRDNAHVMAVVTRIVTQIGRRVDEASPLVDEDLMLVQPRPPGLPEDPPPPPITLQEVARLPLVIPSRPNVIRMHVEAEMAAIGCRPTIALEIDGVSAILDLVADGAGHAILSRNAVASSVKPSAFTVRAIGQPPLRTRLSLATSSARPATLTQQATMELVRATAQARLSAT